MLVSVVTRGEEINGVRQSSRKKSENFLLVNKHIICNAIHRMKNQKVQVSTDNQWISKIILSSVKVSWLRETISEAWIKRSAHLYIYFLQTEMYSLLIE